MRKVIDVEEMALLDCGRTAKGGPFIKLGFHWKDMPIVKRELKLRRVELAAIDKSEKFKHVLEGRTLKIGDACPWMTIEIEEWELFDGYQDEVFYIGISILDDDEHVVEREQKTASKGPYGELAQYLMRQRFFNAPRVREVLQASNDLKASEVKDLFKANIGGQLNCTFESLTEISPRDVQNWITAYDVVFTIPREFFDS